MKLWQIGNEIINVENICSIKHDADQVEIHFQNRYVKYDKYYHTGGEYEQALELYEGMRLTRMPMRTMAYPDDADAPRDDKDTKIYAVLPGWCEQLNGD